MEVLGPLGETRPVDKESFICYMVEVGVEAENYKGGWWMKLDYPQQGESKFGCDSGDDFGLKK